MLTASNIVTQVDPLRHGAEWDEHVRGFPEATFFHTSTWARVLHEAYGHQPVYFRSSSPDGSSCLLPLFEIRSWLTGRRGVSLPFTDECPPCCSDPAAFQHLFEAVIAHARTRSWRYVECRGQRATFGQDAASVSYHGHVLNIDRDERRLFAQCDSAVRRAIRKAAKSGIQVETDSSLEGTMAFYGLVCQTRRRHGVPPQPFSFYEAIQRHVLAPGRGFLLLARYQNRPIAGALFLHFARNGIFKFGASDQSFQHLRANNLVMWEAMRWFCREGFESLHLGRTAMENEGLRRFKLSWGATETVIDHVKYIPARSTYSTNEARPTQWHASVFQALPSSISRIIGTLLYRHVA